MKCPKLLPGKNTVSIPLQPHVPGGCLRGPAGGDQSEGEGGFHARLQVLEARLGKRRSGGFEGSRMSA